MVLATVTSNEPEIFSPEFVNLQAAATALDGFTVADDFTLPIGDYLRDERSIVFWPMLRKKKAEADLNREILKEGFPPVGFTSKLDLDPPVTQQNFAPHDLSDPGQQNKCLAGIIKLPFYSQSLWDQQGRPYGPQLAEKTADLVSSMSLTLERTLFNGNASNNPMEFNGLQAQMAPGQERQIDVTSGERVIKAFRGMVRLAISNEEILKGVTHCFTSALGIELIEEEAETKLNYQNLDKIKPGLSVPSINTQAGSIPLLNSPFLVDSEEADGDYINYWLVDMNTIDWKGVIPKGGSNTFNPQIFDVTKYMHEEYMIEQRMAIMFGTLHALNRGRGIWKLRVKVPTGTIGNIT